MLGMISTVPEKQVISTNRDLPNCFAEGTDP